MDVAIVGAGLIGARRAAAAVAAGDRVLVVADLDSDRARRLAAVHGARSTVEWREAVESDADIVVAATYNRDLMPVATAALGRGKHVLCEKPQGRNAEEACAIRDAARVAGRILKTGFNHRHHPAVARAHDLVVSGEVGEVFALRAAYGHGGRPGYEHEWRGDPDLAGGGELMDQGVHVVDLCRWFLGEVVEVIGLVGTWFWNVAPLEDNGFALLRTESGAVASLHTSWTQWRNLFRFEIFGRDGFVNVEGLGGSYGEERLILGKRSEEGGPPVECDWSFPAPDSSWLDEWNEFRSAIQERREPLGSGEDGYRAALVLDAIYESARQRAVVTL